MWICTVYLFDGRQGPRALLWNVDWVYPCHIPPLKRVTFVLARQTWNHPRVPWLLSMGRSARRCLPSIDVAMFGWRQPWWCVFVKWRVFRGRRGMEGTSRIVHQQLPNSQQDKQKNILQKFYSYLAPKFYNSVPSCFKCTNFGNTLIYCHSFCFWASIFFLSTLSFMKVCFLIDRTVEGSQKCLRLKIYVRKYRYIDRVLNILALKDIDIIMCNFLSLINSNVTL